MVQREQSTTMASMGGWQQHHRQPPHSPQLPDVLKASLRCASQEPSSTPSGLGSRKPGSWRSEA